VEEECYKKAFTTKNKHPGAKASAKINYPAGETKKNNLSKGPCEKQSLRQNRKRKRGRLRGGKKGQESSRGAKKKKKTTLTHSPRRDRGRGKGVILLGPSKRCRKKKKTGVIEEKVGGNFNCTANKTKRKKRMC